MANPSDSTTATATATAGATAGAGARRTFWRWLRKSLAVMVLLLGVTWLVHPWLLSRVAYSLIHVDKLQPVDVLIVIDGGRGFELAARQLDQGQSDSLLLFDRVHSRLVELGVLPSHLELSQRAAERLAISGDVIEEHPEPLRSVKDVLRLAVDRQARGERVGVIVTHWRSALILRELRKLAAGEGVDRPRVFGISDPEVAPEDWWHTRHGIRLVLDQWTRSCAARLVGDEVSEVIRSTEDFERAAIVP